MFFSRSSISIRLKTIATAINLLFPKGRWRPLEMFTRKPVKEEHAIESLSGRRLKIQVWRRKGAGKNSSSALIIYAPFLSSDDPRLINLANTFARAGFVVVLPWHAEGPYILDLREVNDIVSTVFFLRDNPSLGIEYFGLFGISASNGPVMAAAADPRIRELLSFIISFAGYYRIENVLRFITTGQYSYKEIKGEIEPDSYTKEILNKALDYLKCDEESLLTGPKFENLRKVLSPSSFLDQLKAECFIIHSTDDPMIPHTESLRLADELKGRVPVYLSLIDVFEHGAYKKIDFRNIRRHYLPNLIEFYKLLAVLLSSWTGRRRSDRLREEAKMRSGKEG